MQNRLDGEFSPSALTLVPPTGNTGTRESSPSTSAAGPATSDAGTRDSSKTRKPTKGGYSTTNLHNPHPKSSRQPSIEGEEHRLDLIGRESDATNVVILPPIDGGFRAWSYVVSAFAMFIVVWGFPEAWPIFQTYLSSGEKAKHPDSAVIPLLAPGLPDIVEGLLFQVLPRGAKHRRTLVCLGIAIIMVSMVLTSRATSPWQIVLSQGLLFSIGGIMLNFVSVSVCGEWFDAKKGTAMGIIWLGWRVGGLGLPLICQALLNNRGYEATMIWLIPPSLVLLLPSILTFRGRYPASAAEVRPIKPRGSTLKAIANLHILFYLAVTVLFSLVANIPTIFLSRYGADLKISISGQAYVLSLRLLSTMAVGYVSGLLSDKGRHQQLMGLSAISTSLVHILWGFVKDEYMLYVYAIAVGMTSGGYDNCLFGIFTELARNDDEYYMTLYTLFSFVRGAATFTVGIIGVLLIRNSSEVNIDEYALGKYKYLVAYAATMSMVSGLLTLVNMHLYPENPEVPNATTRPSTIIISTTTTQ